MTEIPVGPLPVGWRVIRLGDVCSKIGSGATPRGGGAVYIDNGVTFIRSQNVYDNEFHEDGLVFIDSEAADQLKGVEVFLGDVLLNITGDSILRTCCAPARCLPARVSQHVAIIRPKGDLDSLFLQKYLTLPSVKSYMLGHSAGGTRKAITKGHIEGFLVPLPPLAEQRAIAGVLGALDDKIESNRRIVDLAGKLLSVEYQIAVNGAVDEPYDVRLEVQMGAPFKGENFGEIGNGRPLIRIRDLKTFSSQVWTTEARSDETVVGPGDVLVGMDAEFRSTIWLGESGVLNQRMCRFVGRRGVSRCFSWLSIQSDLEYCERAKSGTTVIHLNKSDIDRFRVPSLNDEQHNNLSAATEPIFDRLVVSGQENSSLTLLRDALLPELLSGRLRVKDAEKVVEGAV